MARDGTSMRAGKTGFYWDERCFWHAGGNYALTLPLGGLVQPLAAGGLPESPETKRRLRNLMEVTGITADLVMTSAPPASRADLERIHPASYLDEFKSMSDAGGGELGLRTPFAKDGYEIAALSAGLAKQALLDVMFPRGVGYDVTQTITWIGVERDYADDIDMTGFRADGSAPCDSDDDGGYGA